MQYKTTKNIPHWLLAIAVTAALLISGTAFAGNKHDKKHSPMRMAEKIADRLEDVLDLSDKQEEQIAAILTKSIEKRQQQRSNAHDDVQQLWKKDTLRAEEIQQVLENKHKNHEAHRAEMHAQHIALVAETMAQVHAVLTPQQRSIASEKLGHMLFLAKGQHGEHGRHSKRGHYGYGH